MSLSADTYTYSHRPVAGVPIGSSAMHTIPLDGTTGTVYHPRATIELALTCNLTSMVAQHTGDRDFTV